MNLSGYLLCSLRCPNSWTQFGNNCYRIFDTYLNQPDAAAFCKAKHLKASLISINFEAEYNFLMQFIQKSDFNDSLGPWVDKNFNFFFSFYP